MDGCPTCFFIESIYAMSLFQIWFYTNDIFKNAGIPEPHIQYTTVGTGAIEVISGMLGVSINSRHDHAERSLYQGDIPTALQDDSCDLCCDFKWINTCTWIQMIDEV